MRNRNIINRFSKQLCSKFHAKALHIFPFVLKNEVCKIVKDISNIQKINKNKDELLKQNDKVHLSSMEIRYFGTGSIYYYFTSA